ncbi:hypothetical protein RvY_14358 [Ramazzottius varieornatus]|uniref:HAT C-terminal dimerisation domain-containing protein n=1 Tax=Ramazzottius varieornatus TaxID=947166 RepID=A0A1D1VR30_RAMVA|nr:hypothetical protein RvY_14358 [Ramazzottius varieornatus]
MDLMDQDFLQPKKLLQIRWVASKQAAIRAIIRDYNRLVLNIGEAVTLAAEGGLLEARLTNLYNIITSTQFNPFTVLAQWIKFKAEFTTDFEPVYWTKENAILMHNILRERHIVFEDEHSELEQLFVVASVLPVSTAICERGFSIQDVIKTIRRTRLNERSLDALMRIAINGPPPGEMDFLNIIMSWVRTGGKNRIQPTTVAGNTTALPEVKLEESVRQCPAAPPCPPSPPCPALPPCPTYNRTEHDLEHRNDRGAKHEDTGDGKCPPPSVKTYSKVGGMEFGAETSCNGTSPEFFLTLGLGSTGMLCFTAIALGYLQYLGKKYRSAPADSADMAEKGWKAKKTLNVVKQKLRHRHRNSWS